MRIHPEPYLVTIPADHPCLPGHFPGRPIVPAVVILDEVRGSIAKAWPDRSIVTIDHCKFQDFVLPDQLFKIELAMTKEAVVQFSCRAVNNDKLLAKGQVSLDMRRGTG